jgi:hypothetical protein
MDDSLPKPSIIAESAKTAYMIFRSSKGVCGGNDFRVLFLKEVDLPSGNAKSSQVEEGRYALDMESLLTRG